MTEYVALTTEPAVRWMQDDEITGARSISSVKTIEAIERSIAAMDTVSSGYYVRQPRTTVDRAM